MFPSSSSRKGEASVTEEVRGIRVEEWARLVVRTEGEKNERRSLKEGDGLAKQAHIMDGYGPD